jgi:hypothetical protein
VRQEIVIHGPQSVFSNANYLETAFFPAIIMPAPAAIKTALMMGDTFSSCLVSMPMDAPPTLTPERSLWGMGTTSEAIPRTTNTTPIQNKPLMVFSFFVDATRSAMGNGITQAILLVPATRVWMQITSAIYLYINVLSG